MIWKPMKKSFKGISKHWKKKNKEFRTLSRKRTKNQTKALLRVMKKNYSGWITRSRHRKTQMSTIICHTTKRLCPVINIRMTLRCLMKVTQALMREDSTAIAQWRRVKTTIWWTTADLRHLPAITTLCALMILLQWLNSSTMVLTTTLQVEELRSSLKTAY